MNGRYTALSDGIGFDFSGSGMEFNAILTEESTIFLEYTATAGKWAGGFHASNTGRYLVAAVWYNTLFGETVSGNAFRPSYVSDLPSVCYKSDGSQATGQLSFNPIPESILTAMQNFADTYTAEAVNASAE